MRWSMNDLAYIVRNVADKHDKGVSFATETEAQKCCIAHNLFNSRIGHICDKYKVVDVKNRQADYKTFKQYKEDSRYIDFCVNIDDIVAIIDKLEHSYFRINFPDDEFYYEYGSIGSARQFLISDFKVSKSFGSKYLMNNDDIKYVLKQQDDMVMLHDSLTTYIDFGVLPFEEKPFPPEEKPYVEDDIDV